MGNKLNAKDLINIGIFTAIYFVLFFATGMTGYIPVMLIFLPLLCPLVTGIPFMLFLTKVKTFGMVTIMGTILGLLFRDIPGLFLF
nr:MptD family putative ECF transporter S component [Sedimentibacter sp.]